MASEAEPNTPREARNASRAEMRGGIPLRTGARTEVTVPRVWGFAELHAHPASHLAFGARPDGTGGPFWGAPGQALAGADPASLPACAPDKHDGTDADLVRHGTRQAIVAQIGALTGLPHQRGGAPDFEGWPHALSLLHQQMHIAWIRRAYDGGLRLLVASVTDNQLLAQMWNVGLNTTSSPLPRDDGFEYASAVRQLDFITAQVRANADWMQLVKTPSEARSAIEADKLAVVLALEMDTLDADEILRLYDSHGVRLVTPVHLVDNGFGGAAVYIDLFNTNNHYLNEKFFAVSGDPLLEFRLSHPERVEHQDLNIQRPVPIPDEDFRKLGYDPIPGAPGGIPWEQGHKNQKGACRAPLQRLMARGMLIDLAHMSERATEETLALAESFRYPLLDTHTDLRDETEHGHSERDLKRSHARRVKELGGVLGLGTIGDLGPRTLVRAAGGPLVRLTGERRRWRHAVEVEEDGDPTVARLEVVITTGDDDLRGGDDNVSALVTIGSREHTFPLNKGKKWKDRETHTVTLPLPAGTRLSTLRGFGLRTTFGSGLGSDEWKVDRLLVRWSGDGEGVLVQESGSPFLHLRGDEPAWSQPLTPPAARLTPETALTALRVTITTGGDDLRGGDDDNAVLTVRTRRHRLRLPLNAGASWGNGSTHTVTHALPPGITLGVVSRVRLETAFGGGTGGDNWEVAAVVLEGRTATGWRELARHRGSPWVRFTGERKEAAVYAGPPPRLPAGLCAEHLELAIDTGGDDLRAGERVDFVVCLRDGARHVFPIPGVGQGNRASLKLLVHLPRGTTVGAIEAVELEVGFTGGADGDNWDIDRVRVAILEDPVRRWLAKLQDAQGVLGGAVGFGTDCNGLAPMIPFSGETVRYPADVALRHGAPEGTRPLERETLGNRTLDFTHDGVAHFGMLPDLLQAVSQLDASDEAVERFYRSAEAFIRTWEDTVAAAARVG